MGSKISIDKYVSQLDDILQLNPKNLEQVNLQSKIPDSITQNIKIWKFYEEDSKSKKILSQPISLQNLQNTNFTFLSKECYVVLVVYRRSKDQDSNTFVSFPHSMWGIVESYNNLTPRGLENPLSTSELNLEILDSFLLPNQKKEKISLNYEHMIFVWNGKTSNPLIKSLALSSAYNLESLIEKGRENILQIFFSGGVILKDKLKNGKVIQLNSTSNKPHNKELEKEISKMSQTIFLFKFLFPLNSFRGNAAPSITGDANQKQYNQIKNQKNQNWIENNQNQDSMQDGNSQNNRGNINNQAESPENEYQQDDINQQQFYSSSSVDSNTTAASETHYLKFFRKQFCEQPSFSNNYINNFIRIPPSSKKSSSGVSAKQFQDTKLGYNNQGMMNEYQFNQQQQMQQQDFQGQEQRIPSNNCLQPEEEYFPRQDHFNQNYEYQNNFEQHQQQLVPQQNNLVPPLNNLNNLNGKKGFSMKLNLTNVMKNNQALPAGVNHDFYNQNGFIAPHDNNIYQNINNQQPNYQNTYQQNQKQQQFNQMGENNNQVGEQNQNIENEEMGGGQTQSEDPIMYLNIEYANVEEETQENHPYKLNLDNLNNGQQNNIGDMNQHIGYNNDKKFEEDPNSPNSDHNDEQQDEVSNIYTGNDNRINRPNLNLQQPLHSHRGSSGPNQTSRSIMADLMRMNQLNLQQLNDQNRIQIGSQQNQNREEQDLNINRNNDIDEDDLYGQMRIQELDGNAINTNLMIKIFAQKCSEIIPNFVYVSGEEVAYNKQKLKQNGITHIINCAGDVCKNLFPDEFVYKTYRLKDAKTENIECVFYDTIQFMEEVAQQGGRVFIHCVQGISRSVTLCMAYKIWKEGGACSFQDALTFVKEKRHVASPNPGFLVQLINFHKRLFSAYDAISVKPRVWCVCSHQIEQPELIVAKMLLEGLYSNNKLDPRGVFIIQSAEKIYIWIGNEIPPERSQIYQDYSLKYIENLKKYEHAPSNLEIVHQDFESEEFWQMWFPSKPQNPYQLNREWNKWFLDITQQPENYQHNYYDDDEDGDDDDRAEGENGQQSKIKPKLFIFPEKVPLNVFDIEDLSDDSLCILCKQQDEQIKIHIWRGSQFNQSDETEKQYLDQIIQDHFPNHINNILLYNEILHKESDEFNECFESN